MRVIFRPEARVEALEAQAWYEAHVPGLGSEFARALEASIESAARLPLAWPTVAGGCRRVLMRRFPFSIIFRSGAESVLVVAVFHHRREPGSWSSRIDG